MSDATNTVKLPQPEAAAQRTWTVYEEVAVTEEAHLEGGFAVGTVLLVQIDPAVVARTGTDACWMVAEGPMLERAESNTPPFLRASRNGQGLTEARAYGIERVARRKV